MRISDWSSDVCSSDLGDAEHVRQRLLFHGPQRRLHQRLILGSLHIAISHMLHRAGEKSARAARGIEDDFAGLGIDAIHRSEESRVGKECVRTFRSRWSQYHSKKIKINQY